MSWLTWSVMASTVAGGFAVLLDAAAVGALILAMAAATAALAWRDASSISACDGVGFATGFGALCASEGGGMKDLWLTANGIAGVTLFDLGCVGGTFAEDGAGIASEMG